MPNASRLYRYGIIMADATTIRVIFVRADAQSDSLILNAQQNLEQQSLSPPNTMALVIQGRGGPKAKTSYARTVTVVMTAAAGGLSVGSRAIIPVFRLSRFNLYAVDQVGTYLGGACRCIAKTEGFPTVRGTAP